MATTTYTVVIDGSPYHLLKDFSDSSLLRDGTHIVAFKVPSTAYTSGDTITIVLDGAISIQSASVRKLNGTELAITEAATTGPAGLSVSALTTVSAVDLYVYIVYNVDITNAQILGS